MTAVPADRIRIIGEAAPDTCAMLEEAGFKISPDAGLIWVMPAAASELADHHHAPATVIVFQPPLRAVDYEQAFRMARSAGGSVRIADPIRHLAAARQFVAAATALRNMGSIGAVRAQTGREHLYSLLHILNDALGRIGPGGHDPTTNTYSGRIAGCPLKIELVDSRQTRITVVSAVGDLLLLGPNGPVIWQTPQGLTEIVGPIPAIPDPAEDLRSALLAEIRGTGSAASMLSRAQQEISLCRLIDRWMPHRPGIDVPAHAGEAGSIPPVHAADLFAQPSSTVHTVPFAQLGRHMADSAGISAIDPQQIAAMQQATAITDTYSRAAMYRVIRSSLPAASAADVVSALGARPRHAWLVRRWLAALLENGALCSADGALSSGVEPTGVTSPVLAAAYAELGFSPLMAQLHAECADHLGELIRDELGIEEILFASQDVVPALTAYQDNVASRYLNAALGDAVDRATPKMSPGRPLRVVELGAGAGVCTSAVLKALGGTPVDYLFTDISPTLISAARQRFEGLVRFGLLDIDADLIDQGCGLRPGSVDVMVAANVLHNAVHIGRSLRRIHRVLRPGGLLALTESTHDSHAVLTSMAFLLSRPTGPRDTDEVFLTYESWRRELAGAGFAIAFDLPDQDNPLALSGQRLILGVAL